MDAIVRLIESVIQGIVSLVQALINSGTLGYLMPLVLLIAVTIIAVTSKNRLSLAGYLLGWVIAVSLMALYMQSYGDRFIDTFLGTIPRTELLTPGIVGLVVGIVLLLPFRQMRVENSQPIIVAFVTTFAIMLLFIAWRASASIPVITTAGQEELIAYRRRYVGIMALWMGVGVLVHILLAAANPPKAPPKAEKKD